eukprot:gene2229-2989_t
MGKQLASRHTKTSEEPGADRTRNGKQLSHDMVVCATDPPGQKK